MARTPQTGARRMLVAGGLLMALAALLLAALGGNGDGGRKKLPEAGSRFREAVRTQPATPAPDADAALERRVAGLIAAGMTPGRRAGRPWGAVLVTDAPGGSARNVRARLARTTRGIARAGGARPLVLADPADLGPLAPPSAPRVAARGRPSDARRAAADAGGRLRAAGVHAVLAPSADLHVAGGPAEGRAFDDDPETVATFVEQAVAGWREARVQPVPGRFPGEGGASQDPLAGPATVGLSVEELLARDARPFAAVAATAPAMQLSAAVYAAWDGVTPATLLPEAVRLLRERLRFAGAIVSADLVAATAATGEGVGSAAVQALRAGCDLLVVTGGRAEQERAYRAVLEAVRRGRITPARFADARRRVAALRRAAGAR